MIGGYLIDKHTAKFETTVCKFIDAYQAGGRKGGKYWIGECSDLKFGFVKAKLRGSGMFPSKGTPVQMITMTSAIRRCHEIDLANDANPEAP